MFLVNKNGWSSFNYNFNKSILLNEGNVPKVRPQNVQKCEMWNHIFCDILVILSIWKKIVSIFTLLSGTLKENQGSDQLQQSFMVFVLKGTVSYVTLKSLTAHMVSVMTNENILMIWIVLPLKQKTTFESPVFRKQFTFQYLSWSLRQKLNPDSKLDPAKGMIHKETYKQMCLHAISYKAMRCKWNYSYTLVH